MCRKNEIHETAIVICRYPSPTTKRIFTCYVFGYTQAFKLMRHLLEECAINDPSEFEFRPVDLEDSLGGVSHEK